MYIHVHVYTVHVHAIVYMYYFALSGVYAIVPGMHVVHCKHCDIIAHTVTDVHVYILSMQTCARCIHVHTHVHIHVHVCVTSPTTVFARPARH